ncbi:TetR/AcrR family transcriptional regulator [Moritella sp.]|uniref:TetR/AcrR family transcriptional regulator n=1 Tax=Moritella sp. TaxID=78556 RepID=UPI001DE74E84|nr:TetR/AcrR family transcriptional regulator [Moritella sp.]MCJ8351907.1 TetR/AcrR family transcriptional regulator [Moritella sp.]NQZ41855.1 TetR/AcrR family transcriptional regulator [Moritella sp.]
MSKGRITREHILNIAFTIASETGLESLTIGVLAKACGMSKSGLFSHFNSKENLQVAVIEYAGECFIERVIVPVRRKQHTDVTTRLQSLLQHWLDWNHSFQGSCMFMDAWKESNSNQDVLQQTLRKQLHNWISYLEIQISKGQQHGLFRQDLVPRQAVFQFYGLYLSSHLFHSLELENNERTLFWQGVTQLYKQWQNTDTIN